MTASQQSTARTSSDFPHPRGKPGVGVDVEEDLALQARLALSQPTDSRLRGRVVAPGVANEHPVHTLMLLADVAGVVSIGILVFAVGLAPRRSRPRVRGSAHRGRNFGPKLVP
jgi:hypothetical protein